jgi:uncharacterized protein YuzE
LKDGKLLIKVEYDSKADTLYLWLRKTKNAISEEKEENVIIDKDKKNRIIGMEILKASETAKHLGGLLETIEIMQDKKLKKDREPASKDIKECKTVSLDKLLRELNR